MESLLKVLMRRDGLLREEALQQIAMAKAEVLEGADPEEVLADWFGLEPDYLYDLLA
jgi:hypothetical protein